MIASSQKAGAESIQSDAFFGDWTNTEGNCDEDVPNGIEVIHISRDSISWWEIDCHVESVREGDKILRAAVSCAKGGGATAAGLL